MTSYSFDAQQLAIYLERAINVVDEDEHMGYTLEFVPEIAEAIIMLRREDGEDLYARIKAKEDEPYHNQYGFELGDTVEAISHAEFSWGLETKPGDRFPIINKKDLQRLDFPSVLLHFKKVEK